MHKRVAHGGLHAQTRNSGDDSVSWMHTCDGQDAQTQCPGYADQVLTVRMVMNRDEWYPICTHTNIVVVRSDGLNAQFWSGDVLDVQ